MLLFILAQFFLLLLVLLSLLVVYCFKIPKISDNNNKYKDRTNNNLKIKM